MCYKTDNARAGHLSPAHARSVKNNVNITKYTRLQVTFATEETDLPHISYSIPGFVCLSAKQNNRHTV